ncbi:MAG TPA: hypothetical protein VFN19_08335 [Candidatus Nanopelagicales bacterium]|jgi:hypothetical protein|nr:hypothetical protein [Candidatus Nanopelagicales bacterium]
MSAQWEPAALARTWVHAYEEDSDTTTVYRSAGEPLPPARGRGAFTLAPDGTLTLERPGADDRTVRRAGRWSVTGDRLVLQQADGVEQQLQVISVAADRLVVRR